MNIIDERMFKFLLKSIRTWGPFEYLMAVFAASFNNEILTYVWIIAFVSVPISYGTSVICCLLPILISKATCYLKEKICRERPTLYQPRIEALMFEFRKKDSNYSMPSCDSAQAAAFWTFFCKHTWMPWWIGILMTIGTMFSRVYYMCHYPTDGLVGAFIGMMIALLMDYIILG
ncbi:unnamed protein product [Blepharisma stoltei]|uniref:Phosphatidic acid phosphatase type 2/haloperoxidase domain-containing protein n=1 Tax=Blepharisma stoltei TaxID=1481888 RepID=A0AAU9JC94_9CILI|nr:unnamed protein product [Blepharisma stoltei]